MPSKYHLKTALLALFSLILVLTIISFPKQAFESSLRGLTIWWEVVFPALLPFFITSELLMGFGVVHFIGVLLEPLMRPLFRVPGVGGFVMSMGIASGYPMGAKLTVKLREEKIITRSEGERLVSITSTSGPLFMFGAVAVGFFHDVKLGIIIAASHYLAAFLVGIIMRFHDIKNEATTQKEARKKSLIYKALQEMHRARVRDGRTFGTLMGDAVMNSIQTLLMVGGFIIMFSVIINIMSLIGLSALLATIFSVFCILLGISTELSHAFIAGIFEITLGSQTASEGAASIPLVHKVAVASAIIAWSGLSVHAQVASMLAKTDIRYTPYLFSRCMHAILAGICTIILWEPFNRFLSTWEAFANDTYHHRFPNIYWDNVTILSLSIILTLCIFICCFILVKVCSFCVKR